MEEMIKKDREEVKCAKKESKRQRAIKKMAEVWNKTRAKV